MAVAYCAFLKPEQLSGRILSAKCKGPLSGLVASRSCIAPRSQTSFGLFSQSSNSCRLARERAAKRWGLGGCQPGRGEQVARRHVARTGTQKEESDQLEPEELRIDARLSNGTVGGRGHDEENGRAKERGKEELSKKAGVSDGEDGKKTDDRAAKFEEDEVRHIRRKDDRRRKPTGKGNKEAVRRRALEVKAPAVPSVKQKKILREARLNSPPTSPTRGAGRTTRDWISGLTSTGAPFLLKPVEEWGLKALNKLEGSLQVVEMSLPVARRRTVMALVRIKAHRTCALVTKPNSETMIVRVKAPGTLIVLRSAVSLAGRDVWRSSALISESKREASEARRAENSDHGFDTSETLSSSSEQQNWVRVETSGEVEQELSFTAEEKIRTQTRSKALNAPDDGEFLTGAQGDIGETREARESKEKAGMGPVPSRAQLGGTELGQPWREAVTHSSEDDSELHGKSNTGVLDLETETATKARLLENDLERGLKSAGTGNDDQEIGSEAPVEATEKQSAASSVSPGRVNRGEDEGIVAKGGQNDGPVRSDQAAGNNRPVSEEPVDTLEPVAKIETVAKEAKGKRATQSVQPAIPQEPGPAEARARAIESALTSETRKRDPPALGLLTSLLALLHLPPHVLPRSDAAPGKALEVPKPSPGVEAVQKESSPGTEVVPGGQRDDAKEENGPIGGVQEGGLEVFRAETQGQVEGSRESLAGRAVIKVIGIGGGGCNAVDRMVQDGVGGVTFWAINTDAQQLRLSHAEHKMQIGRSITHGKGSGGNTRLAELASEEHHKELEAAVDGADLVFIAAGLGGGVGTGIAPIVGKLAKATEALTIGIVTEPFTFEGAKRARIARNGIEALRAAVDALVVVPNDRLLDLVTEKTPFDEAFRMADGVLRQGVQGISDIITTRGLVNVDLADVRAIMKDAGDAILGVGEGSGPDRALTAAARALGSPLQSLEGKSAPTGVIYNLTSGKDLTLQEMFKVAETVAGHVHPAANIIVGTVIDEAFLGKLRMTIIFTGFQDESEEDAATDAHTAYEKSCSDSDTLRDSPGPSTGNGPHRRGQARGTG